MIDRFLTVIISLKFSLINNLYLIENFLKFKTINKIKVDNIFYKYKLCFRTSCLWKQSISKSISLIKKIDTIVFIQSKRKTYTKNFRSIGWYVEIFLMLHFSCAIFRRVKIVQALSFCSLSLNHFMINYSLWDIIRESKLCSIQCAPSIRDFFDDELKNNVVLTFTSIFSNTSRKNVFFSVIINYLFWFV